MKDIKIDKDGVLHCANCGATTFNAQRTAKSKVAFGFASLLADQKLKCLSCGAYNKGGNAQPFEDHTAEWAKGAVRPTAKEKKPSWAERMEAATEAQKAKNAARPKVSFREAWEKGRGTK